MNRNNGFNIASEISKNGLICIITNCNSDLNRLLEPVVLLQLFQTMLIVIGRLTVRKQEDCGSKRTSSITHESVTRELLVQLQTSCAQIGHTVSIQVIPSEILGSDGSTVNPSGTSREREGGYLNLCICVALGNIFQFRHNFFDCRVYCADLSAAHTSGSINNKEKNHRSSRYFNDLIIKSHKSILLLDYFADISIAEVDFDTLAKLNNLAIGIAFACSVG